VVTSRKIEKRAVPLSLEEKLAAIGVTTATERPTTEQISAADLEEALADVIVSFAAPGNDQRWLGPVLAWVEAHGSAVIIEKLTKILKRRNKLGDNVEFASLLATYALAHGHKRWQSLLLLAPVAPRLVGHPDLAPSLLEIRGAEAWAKTANFLVPNGSLVPQGKWILSPSSVAMQNQQYRNRLIYGAQWRADIITAIQRGARNPTEASMASGASYEPCHRVFRELEAAGVVPAKF